MSKRCAIVVILLFVALPSILYARWIKDKAYLQTDEVGKVEFSHYSHMEQKSIGKNCPTCHNEVFHIVTEKNKPVSMNEMEDGVSCGVCHDGKKAFSVTGDCTTCHAGDVEMNYGISEKVVFSHDVHADMFGCDECHPDLFVPERNSNQVGMQQMEQGESCGACHDGDMAFGVASDCGTCHAGAEDIAMQSSVGEVLFSHDAHTANFGCDECHPDIFKPKANANKVGMKAMETGASCGACHDGDMAFGVKSDCITCHQGASDIAMQSPVGAVTFSHDMHTDMFGCSECHPDLFVSKANSNQVGMKKMEEGESCGACHDGDMAFDVKGDCSTCHSGEFNFSEMIEMQSSVGAVPFAHDVHTEMFGCDECHPDVFKASANSNQVGMKKMEQGESCGTCHDGDTAFGVKDDCTSCHAGALDLAIMTENVGTVDFSHDLHTEMFGCDECHPDTFKPKLNSNQVGMQKMEKGASCGACHDGDTAFGVEDDCVSCHTAAVTMTMKADQVAPVPFSHAVHTDSFGCDECHPDIFKPQANSNQVGMMAMEQGQSCGACHDGDMAFSVSEDCATCHVAGIDFKKDVAIRSPAWSIVFSHKVHTETFTCEDCHPTLFKAKANSTKVGMKKMEEGESCGACHDGDTAFTVEENCISCHNRTAEMHMAAAKVGSVPFSHAVHVDMFGCDECHPEPFKPVPNGNQVGMKKMEAGESCGTCHDGDTAFGVSGDCATCHVGATGIAMRTQSVGIVTFQHLVHTDMFSCDECHPDTFVAEANSNRVGMAAMEQGQSCGACHDGETAFGVKDDCATCHTGADEVAMRTPFVGNVPFSHSIHTDMYACDECHPGTFIARANSNQVGMQSMEAGASCGACHNGQDAFTVAENCSSCHADDIEFNAFGKTIFSHEVHNEMFACSECHPRPFEARRGANKATMSDMEGGISCGACHNGRQAFGITECNPCHIK